MRRDHSRPCISPGVCVVLGAGLWAACSSPPSSGLRGTASEAEGGTGGSGGSSSSSSGASSGSGGNPGNPSSSSGAASAAGVDAAAAGLPEAGGGSSSGSLGPGGSSGSGGSSDAGGATSSGGTSGTSDGGSGKGGDAGVAVPPGCTLPATVSFKTDVQPFLATSCGNGGVNGASGCHVLDASSTTAQGGFDHAYDWITGTAHASSCPEVPTPFRFQVVIPVIDQANPPSCSQSRIMPPSGTPLTACQVAALQAWLNEPMVTQTHRNDGISPTTPYPMPPFN